MNEIVKFDEMDKMANAICKSGLFGIKDANQAVALMLIAQAEGRHPAMAARDYHIIDGKPSLKSDAMLARFQESGGKVEWITLTDDKCVAKFSKNGTSATIDWDIARAKKAGVYREKTYNGSTGMWVKYPRQMLRSRVSSEGIRTVDPGVVCGVYTPEEVQDFSPQVQEKPAVVLAAQDDLEIARGALKAAGIKLSESLATEIRGGVTRERLSEIVEAAIQGAQGTASLKEKLAKANPVEVETKIETTDFPGNASGS